MVGSSKYAPLTNLPSQSMSPVSLPVNCVYKPSWMQHVEKSSSQTSTSTNSSSTSSNSQQQSQQPQQQSQSQQPTPQITQQPPQTISQQPPQNILQNPNSAVATALHQNSTYPPSPLSTGFRPPPPPYELPSPATSTASSYLNKNLNSVEQVSTPSIQRTPEASSLLVNILLADTALNIFRDHNFDSCTLCVCNAGLKVVGNIRGADAGVYLMNNASDRSLSGVSMQQPSSPYPGAMVHPPLYGMLSPQHHPQTPAIEEDSVRCSCGFSAVVNRRMSHRSGLFYEDEMEITGKTIFFYLHQ